MLAGYYDRRYFAGSSGPCTPCEFTQRRTMPGIRRLWFRLQKRIGISRNVFCEATTRASTSRRPPRKCILCSGLAADRACEPRLSRGERFGRQRRPPLVMNGPW